MPNYHNWNQILIDYSCQGIPQGSQIYLSVDEDILQHLGQKFFPDIPINHIVEDFTQSVINHLVYDNEVNLKVIKGFNTQQQPLCVAFLGLTVLAAHQMANEDKISELNYFRRLREILQIPGEGRPKGLKSGEEAEENLWKTWNYWLLAQGLIPSAKPGKGPQKYINYPISQSLLRQTDKNKLQELFFTKEWKYTWDASILFTQVKRSADQNALNSHLKELILNTKQGAEAIKEAIHELHSQWLELGCPATTTQENNIANYRSWRRNLFAGIYRTEDPFLGQVEYYLYPKQPRGKLLEKITIEYQNKIKELTQERAGWYLPIGEPLDLKSVSKGFKCPIINHPELEQLNLTARDFWVLIPDPDNPESEIFASWGTPSLGTPFILLFQSHLLKDLEHLKAERLLNWNGNPYPIDEQETWLEIQQCLVLSQTWNSVFIECQELKDALMPNTNLSITFSGGLRIPQEKGWLKGYTPEVTIFSFSPKVNLEVINLGTDNQVCRKTVSTNQPISLDLPKKVGNYLIKATLLNEKESTERYLRVLDWESLSIITPNRQENTQITENYQLCGAVIKNN